MSLLLEGPTGTFQTQQQRHQQVFQPKQYLGYCQHSENQPPSFFDEKLHNLDVLVGVTVHGYIGAILLHPTTYPAPGCLFPGRR